MKLTKKQHTAINAIAKKYNLQMVLLFGSQVKGTIHMESDIDIAMLSKKTLASHRESRIASDFMNILGDVDLVNIRTAGPLLMKEIFSNAEVLYQQDILLFDTYYVYAMRRYAEAKPLFDLTAHSIRKYAYGT